MEREQVQEAALLVQAARPAVVSVALCHCSDV
jgi:hypothetical protein